MAAVSASSRRTSNMPCFSTAARSPGMLSTNCCRGLKLRTGNGPNPSAEVSDGCRQTTAKRPTTSTRHDSSCRRWDGTMSVGEIEAGEDRSSLLAPSIIDSTDNVRSNDSAESDARRHAVVFETDVFEAVEHLSCIQERRNFEIGRDAS